MSIGYIDLKIIKIGKYSEYLADYLYSFDARHGSFDQRLSSALKKIGIVKSGETIIAYEELNDYVRKGEETYVAAARVILNKEHRRIIRSFVSKAVISGDELIKSMLRRRYLLQSQNIHVPELYSVTDACINEELIPYDLDCVLGKELYNLEVLNSVIHAAAVLDWMGFRTLNFLSDMRTDGKFAYYIDFGWDLADPSDSPKDNAFNTLLSFVELRFPKSKGYVEGRYNFEKDRCRK